MTAVIICFVVGIILLALEVVVPGAILGVIGGLSMLVGVVVSFATFGPAGGAVATATAVILLGVVVYLEFVWLPRSRLARGLSMTTTVDGTSQPPLAHPDEVVGREAVAQTPLVPTGYVQVDDRRFEAFSRSGHVAAGSRLKVVGLDNFRLIVIKP